MMPYEIIITSSARPHLLQPTLISLLVHVDTPPQRILIHDDARFDDADARWTSMKEMLAELTLLPCEVLVTHADPPRRLGLALVWLLANVQAEYVLYSQDDFVTVRDLPMQQALATMEMNHLHQIRFNKRATLGQKDTWQGVWTKKEMVFGESDPVTCTVSDHWYFQTGLWRVSVIRAALAWLTATPERTALFAGCPAEVAINHVMDGAFGPIPGLSVPYHGDALDPVTRSQVQRTFIWEKIGTDRFIRHIGLSEHDWAGDHARGEATPTRWQEKQRQAWAEIATYDDKETSRGD
jgi:hypothetical protein